MALVITGHHIEVTEAIRENITKHFDKLNDRFPCISQKLSFKKEGHEFKVTAEYKTDSKGIHVAQATNENLYQAVGDVVDKLTRMLRESKEKR